jgi:hypothetical protein
MSNREIIELANIIAERPCDSEDCAPCIRTGRRCNDYLKAERAIQAGYHKQVNGEWIEKGEYLKILQCSVCSHTTDTIFDRTHYCPNCGAKMKGGE